MQTITFEIYNADFFLEISIEVERSEVAATVANLAAMPNVRNLTY